MPIIERVSPADQDIEALKASTKQDIVSAVNASFRSLYQSYNYCSNLVWKNKELTAQQVLDAFGPEASQLVLLDSTLKTLINQFQPGAIPEDALKIYQVNEDGTVTAGPA